LIWKLVQNISPEQTTIVSNSHSVSKSLDHTPWENYPREVIYNPSGLNVSRSNPDFKTLGFVSMMAPWKGVHEILVWAKLYEKELSNIGIEKINIYGDDIYQTLGEHQSYKKDLIDLKQKLEIRKIEFKGLKRPDEIFSEIDCLIHYSLKPEPFGRVIIEAFESGIPVISTALGGASEMIEDKNNGIKVFPYDRQGLFQAIEMLAKNKVVRLDFIKKSKAKSLVIQKEIEDKMNNLFIEEKVS
jgi:glycosyltransferase involved in cell wall biosynthesis